MKRSATAIMAAGSVAALIACTGDPSSKGPASVLGPNAHVGFPRGETAPLGFVTNSAECHIGKRGARWPAEEQYEVRVFDAHLVVTPSGVMNLSCHGDIPADQPRPESAEVEKDVLCFLPNGVQTRDAQEVFTPSGKIHLSCHYNPNKVAE